MRQLVRMLWWYWKAPSAVREAIGCTLLCLHDWEAPKEGWKFALYFGETTFDGAVGGPVEQPIMKPYISGESVTYGGETSTFSWTMEPQHG